MGKFIRVPDMPQNRVHIEGVVKRDATATRVRNGLRVMDFCLVVPSDTNDNVFVDCFCAEEGCEVLNDHVMGGESLGVDGFLTFRSYTDAYGRKKSGMVVYVRDAYEIEM